MYRCKECKLAVIVHEGQVIKACNCKAPIVADMAAKATGKGGVKA